MKGLPVECRRVAGALLDAYGPWNAAHLQILRSFVLSIERVRLLEATGPANELHREMRCCLALLTALNLEK